MADATVQNMLEIKELYAGYGEVEVLHGISLTVKQGEIVSLIGANGAGKSTLLMCISAIIKARKGSVTFKGQNLSGLAAHELPGLGLAQVPEGRKIFPRLSVNENLDLGAYLRRDKTQIETDRERVFSLFPILAERKSQAGGTLSGGEQQMLAIGRALMSKPSLLLMDEPSMGVAPMLVAKILETVKELNKQGMTILLVEQNAHAALSLAMRGYVLETGSIVLESSAAELLKNERVRKAYLGE